MTEKFKGKYRIGSARLQNWDYGWNAPYFVTICTQNREHYFGDIVNYKMELSEIGEIAQTIWFKIPEQFPYVHLDAFVVMPNHIHGIVIIDKKDDNGRIAINRDSTIITTKKIGGITGNKNPMLHENLSRIIRWYKGRATFECRNIHADFAWQPRFYEHIIRNNASYQRIDYYINNNPENWKEDKFSGNNNEEES